MAHLGVPLAIDAGGAKVSAVIMRRQSYAANNGIEGVVRPLDCRVVQTPTASGNILVSTGDYVINSRKAVGEAYNGWVNRADPDNEEDLVPIAPNNTGSPRYDLVYVRVENPYAPGENWQEYPVGDTRRVNGPYVFTRVLQGVPESVRQMAQTSRLNDTAMALTLLKIPPMTAAITNAMVYKDLRQIAGSGARATDGTLEQSLVMQSILCDGGDVLLREHLSYRPWPAQATCPVAIPSFATGVDVMMADVTNGVITRFDGIGTKVNAYVFGDMRLKIGDSVGAPTPFDFNVLMEDGGNGERRYFAVGGTQPIPPELRGTVQTCRLESRMIGSNLTGHLEAKGNTRFRLQLNFTNQPSYE